MHVLTVKLKLFIQWNSLAVGYSENKSRERESPVT